MPTIPTLLVLTGVGIPPYSARGLTQTLVPIGQSAQYRRTINGALRDLSDETFRKYSSIIRGDDMDPPALDGVWPGLILTVDCIPELCFAGAIGTEVGTEGTEELATEQTYGKTPVPGSIREADGFIFFRPRLQMLVTDFNIDRNEWQATTGWTLALEEV
jgi:hypothetical protein